MPQTIQLKPEDTLFKEGDLSNSLYIVRRGAISIRKVQRRTLVEAELTKVKAGEIIGELSFFDRKTRSASAIALIETELLELNFQELDLLYSQTPDYFKKIIESLASRLRTANEMIANLKSQMRE
jgi:CRP/FNR family cyclic AMP-dependent transcriptional regulator